MPRVIAEATPEKEKKVTCGNCCRVIGYFPSEIREYNGTDISGGPDGCTYITCPGKGCRKRIIFDSW